MITIDPIKRPPKKSSSVDTTEIMKEVDQKFADFIGGAPEKLDTIKELADAIENLPNLDNFITNETLNKLLLISKYEFVDLGLPSGLKWASCNVGAEKPEDFGLYFAWGETEGYSGITDERQFSLEDYKLCGGSISTLTKYNNDSSYGTVDTLTTLEQVDDAAYTSDNTCRIPTSGECQELIDNTTSTWETLNGVNGRRFTSKRNSNSIFVPAAGNCLTGTFNGVGSYGHLWSSSLYESGPWNAWSLRVKSDGVDMRSNSRYAGYMVRAVQEANIPSKFDPKNYYTKSEIDNMIISTLNTEV